MIKNNIKHKFYFETYEAFGLLREVMVGNNQMTLAYGKGRNNVEIYLKRKWHQNYLADVRYDPKIGRNLF